MKKIYTTILAACLILGAQAQAPSLEWTKRIGDTGYDSGNSIAVDANGNVYTIGSFQEEVNFNPGSGLELMGSWGSYDVFIQKLDADGNFLWVKRMGSNGSDSGFAIATDASGNIYTTGYFTGTVDFDPGADQQYLSSLGSTDIFIQKLDTDGNFLWAKQMGGSSGDTGYSIATDANGNVYTTGYFRNTVDFDPGLGVQNFISAGAPDIFIQKLDTDGNFLWAKQAGGSSWDEGSSIIVDADGDVYTTGHFKETVDFDPGPGVQNFTSNAIYSSDIFVQKLDTDGNFLWAKQMGGNETDQGQSITTDAGGNVYTTGYFRNTVDFDPGTGVQNFTALGGYENIFIQKLDADGNFLWAKHMEGNASAWGQDITIGVSGNVYVTGRFQQTVDFNPGTGIYPLTSEGGLDIFVQKLDADGEFIWTVKTGGDDSDDSKSITTDASGNVYTAGYLNNFSSNALYDIFIQKLNDTPACVTDLILINPNDNYQTGDQIQQTVGNSITANNTVGTGAEVSYDAGSIISLESGFSVEVGSNFEAIIGGCTP